MALRHTEFARMQPYIYLVELCFPLKVMMRVCFIFGWIHSSVARSVVFTAFTAFFASTFSHSRFSSATSENRLWRMERM